MRILFPILATVVALLLAAGYYAGLVGRPDDLGRGVRLASMVLALVVHAGAFAYFWSTGRKIEAIVGREGLPEWVGAQAEKNRRKALLYQVSGSIFVVVGVGLLLFEYRHPIYGGSSVSFQVGAFLNEFLVIQNQSRLLAELAGQAGPGASAVEP